jgi:hypothetical protein
MVQYFCCRLAPQGIGDQVSQLQRLYNLGRSFGLEYLFQTLPPQRLSPGFDATDFLGLDLDERRVEEFTDHEIVAVDGALASFALAKGQPLETVLPEQMPKRAIVEFVHSPKLYCNGIPVPVRHTIDLRAKLIQRHGGQILVRRSNRLSVCVHIRQGDCTWVRSGKKYVFLGTRKITSNPDDVDVQRAPRIEDYVPVMDALVTQLAGVPYDIGVYSDGPTNIFPNQPGRAGRLLYACALRDERVIHWLRLNRTDNPLQALYNPMSDPEVRRESEQVQTGLQRFIARYPGSTPVIGTSKSLTAAAIIAFASADIVLLARNATVFPLLGLGDPQDQAVLTLSSPISESMSRVERLLAKRAVGS